MGLDLNTLINLGVLGVLAYLVVLAFETRGDVRVIKSKLGINGSGPGLIQDVEKLKDAAGSVDGRIGETRHQLRNEMAAAIGNTETRLSDRIERLENPA